MSRYQQGDPVEEARLLLPWYITGKLNEPERTLVEDMLQQHPALKEDYLRELRMVDLIRANASLLELTTVDSTQQRLDKLMKRIQREENASPHVASPPLPHAPETRPHNTSIKPGGFMETLRKFIPTFEWLTPTNAVFASLLLIQAGLVGWFAHSSMGKQQEGIYLSASDVSNEVAVPAVKGMVLLVDFNEQASIGQVRDFLNKWNARIMDGPDANNLFKLEIRNVAPTDPRADAVLQQMQQDPALVLFAGRGY